MGHEENGCQYLILLHINVLLIFRQPIIWLRLVFQVQLTQYRWHNCEVFTIMFFCYLFFYVDYGEALIMEENGTHLYYYI